jgi:anti-sigma B factor antagonist
MIGCAEGHDPRPMSSDFAIQDRPVDDTTHVVAVAGEIDLFTAPEFKQRVSAPIDAGRTRLILSAATFIDSSSLGVLIGAHRQLKRRGGTVVVVCDAEPIVKTFRITGLDGVFRLVPTMDEAFDGDGAVRPAAGQR